MITTELVKQWAKELGADLCGVASLGAFDDSPKGFHPKDVYSGVKSAIAIALRIPEGTMLAKTQVVYTVVDDLVSNKLDQVVIGLCDKIERTGAKAVLIPSVPYDYWDEASLTGKGIISLKHMAQKAGLGYIGRNSILCNPTYGNLVLLGGLLTDAELEPDKPLDGDMGCDSCLLCEATCPVGAISDFTVDQALCRPFSETKNSRGANIISCNECRRVCPYMSGM
jgi:epoxyqueuosine reductase QueG